MEVGLDGRVIRTFDNILDQIVSHKEIQVEQLREKTPLAELEASSCSTSNS